MPFPLLNPSSGSVYKLNPTTSFLATFRTSTPLALCVARLPTSWRTSKDAFSHNLPAPALARFRPNRTRWHLSWVSQRPPLYRHPSANPVPERPKPFLRSAAATRPSSSASRVSHPPDGLLLANFRRLVASCYRLWGSSRFASLADSLIKNLRDTLPAMPLTPFKAFPSLAAAPCHQGPCLLAVSSRARFRSRSPQPQGFALRKKVRCIRQALPPDLCPLLSWALFPSKALPSRVAPNRPSKRAAQPASLRCLVPLPARRCRNTCSPSTRPASEDHPTLKVASVPFDSSEHLPASATQSTEAYWTNTRCRSP